MFDLKEVKGSPAIRLYLTVLELSYFYFLLIESAALTAQCRKSIGGQSDGLPAFAECYGRPLRRERNAAKALA